MLVRNMRMIKSIFKHYNEILDVIFTIVTIIAIILYILVFFFAIEAGGDILINYAEKCAIIAFAGSAATKFEKHPRINFLIISNGVILTVCLYLMDNSLNSLAITTSLFSFLIMLVDNILEYFSV